MQKFFCQCDGKAPDLESHRLEVNYRIRIRFETSAHWDQCGFETLSLRASKLQKSATLLSF